MRKDGAHYQRGAGLKLAADLKKPPSWVSNYVDDAPTRNADLDTALAICRAFGVKVSDFEDGSPPQSAVATPSLSRHQIRVLKLMEQMNEKGQRLAARSIAAYADAFPRSMPQESVQRTLDSGSGTTRKARGSR